MNITVTKLQNGWLIANGGGYPLQQWHKNGGVYIQNANDLGPAIEKLCADWTQAIEAEERDREQRYAIECGAKIGSLTPVG